MPLTWDLPVGKRASLARSAPAVETLTLDCGWEAVVSRGAAFGQTAAKSCARSLQAAVQGAPAELRPWAVKGEVPSEDETSACGCTTVVFCGVRMQLPEKTFGSNWLELRHAESGLVFCFDCAGALRRWSELSLSLIDDSRAGRPCWSGWTCDAELLHKAWAESAWGQEERASYVHREEWDWTYRSDYSGVAVVGAAAAGSSARDSSALKSHMLIRMKPLRAAPQPAADARPLGWAASGDLPPSATHETEAEWGDAELVSEASLKLYEDHLAELGVASLTLRLRECAPCFQHLQHHPTLNHPTP